MSRNPANPRCTTCQGSGEYLEYDPMQGWAARPTTRHPDFGDWKFDGWEWCSRALFWHPRWRNATLQARAVEGAGYWRVTGRGRAYGTGDTFADAWSAMVQREFAAEDAKRDAPVQRSTALRLRLRRL